MVKVKKTAKKIVPSLTLTDEDHQPVPDSLLHDTLMERMKKRQSSRVSIVATNPNRMESDIPSNTSLFLPQAESTRLSLAVPQELLNSRRKPTAHSGITDSDMPVFSSIVTSTRSSKRKLPRTTEKRQLFNENSTVLHVAKTPVASTMRDSSASKEMHDKEQDDSEEQDVESESVRSGEGSRVELSSLRISVNESISRTNETTSPTVNEKTVSHKKQHSKRTLSSSKNLKQSTAAGKQKQKITSTETSDNSMHSGPIRKSPRKRRQLSNVSRHGTRKEPTEPVHYSTFEESFRNYVKSQEPSSSVENEKGTPVKSSKVNYSRNIFEYIQKNISPKMKQGENISLQQVSPPISSTAETLEKSTNRNQNEVSRKDSLHDVPQMSSSVDRSTRTQRNKSSRSLLDVTEGVNVDNKTSKSNEKTSKSIRKSISNLADLHANVHTDEQVTSRSRNVSARTNSGKESSLEPSSSPSQLSLQPEGNDDSQKHLTDEEPPDKRQADVQPKGRKRSISGKKGGNKTSRKRQRLTYGNSEAHIHDWKFIRDHVQLLNAPFTLDETEKSLIRQWREAAGRKSKVKLPSAAVKRAVSKLNRKLDEELMYRYSRGNIRKVLQDLDDVRQKTDVAAVNLPSLNTSTDFKASLKHYPEEWELPRHANRNPEIMQLAERYAELRVEIEDRTEKLEQAKTKLNSDQTLYATHLQKLEKLVDNFDEETVETEIERTEVLGIQVLRKLKQKKSRGDNISVHSAPERLKLHKPFTNEEIVARMFQQTVD